jgi:hypothetical protein
MTNTLHRFGEPQDLKDDYIVFMMAAKGINDHGASEKVQAFMQASLKYEPLNMGKGILGSLYRPESNLNLVKVYLTGRKERMAPAELVHNTERPDDGAVVFDSKEKMKGFFKEVKELDLGLSVNASGLVDDIQEVCMDVGIPIHSIEYSLGFHGDLARLPDRHVLAITTMCGHGMISAHFATKMIAQIKEARISPEKAAETMAKFCVCGVFNTQRAIRILNEIRTSD